MLDGKSEQQPTSDDCVTRLDRKPGGGIRCEPEGTQDLLEEIQQTEGAIGYAELDATTNKRYVATVQIDGISPNASSVRAGFYDFWTIEYLYTRHRHAGSDQHLACTSDDVSRLCQQEH